MKRDDIPKIFISYSHKDEWYKDELIKFLTPLKNSSIIDWWEAGALIVGEKYTARIIHQINHSQIFLLLVSPESLSSEYINNIELKLANELNAKNQIIIVPTIIRPCNWKILNLKNFHAAPIGGKAISLYKNKDIAFKQITESILKLANQLNQPKENNSFKESDGVESNSNSGKPKNKGKIQQTAIYHGKIKADTFIGQVDKLIIKNKK